MKHLLYILITLFLISSCNDSITFEDKESIDPPIVIDGPVITGRTVSPKGDNISNVTLKLYQNDKEIGIIYSDVDGKYSTHTIDISGDSPVTIHFEKEDYDSKYRRFSFDEQLSISKDVTIGKPLDPNSNEVTKFSNPSDINLVKLYGYTKYADGRAATGVRVFAGWNYLGFFVFEGNSNYITDSDGYFELLVPQDTIIHFGSTYLLGYPEMNYTNCYKSFTVMNNPSSFLENYNKLGLITENTEVIMRSDIEFDEISSTISGIALKCDGTPITSGILKCNYKLHDNPILIAYKLDDDYTFGPNGEFEVYIEACKTEGMEEYKINIQIQEHETAFWGEKTIDFSETVNIGEIKSCNDPQLYPGNLTLSIDSETTTYAISEDHYESKIDKLNIVFRNDYSEHIFCKTVDIQLGQVPLEHFYGTKFNHIKYDTFFEAKPGMVTLTISKIEDNYVYGELIGEVVSPTGNKSISGTFKVYNK